MGIDDLEANGMMSHLLTAREAGEDTGHRGQRVFAKDPTAGREADSWGAPPSNSSRARRTMRELPDVRAITRGHP